jgi:hypothetical protein
VIRPGAGLGVVAGYCRVGNFMQLVPISQSIKLARHAARIAETNAYISVG